MTEHLALANLSLIRKQNLVHAPDQVISELQWSKANHGMQRGILVSLNEESLVGYCSVLLLLSIDHRLDAAFVARNRMQAATIANATIVNTFQSTLA